MQRCYQLTAYCGTVPGGLNMLARVIFLGSAFFVAFVSVSFAALTEPPGSPKTIIASATITNDGTTLTVAAQDGTWITSVVFNNSVNPGLVTVTFAPNIFAATPRCVASVKGGDGTSEIHDNHSAQSVAVQTVSGGVNGATEQEAARNFTIICIGAR